MARGLAGASALFAASFALHIVAGALDQGWLFAIAVGLIYVTATAFPVIALRLARAPARSFSGLLILAAGAAAGVGFTWGALWAANGRAMAWWEPLAAVALVAVASVGAARVTGWLSPGRRSQVVGTRGQPRRS